MLKKMSKEEQQNHSGGLLFVSIVGSIIATAWAGTSMYKMLTSDSGNAKLPVVGGDVEWETNQPKESKSLKSLSPPPSVYVY